MKFQNIKCLKKLFGLKAVVSFIADRWQHPVHHATAGAGAASVVERQTSAATPAVTPAVTPL